MTEYRLLGPVALVVDGRVESAGQPRQQCVLAALLVDAGRPVPLGTLINRVWGGDLAPERARHSLQTYVARIRQLLATVDPSARLIHREGAYLLEVSPDRVDLHRFRQFVKAGEPRQALDLWQGEPLAGLAGDWPEGIRVAWRAERVRAAIAWAAAAGYSAEVIGLLTDLADEYPYDEELAAALSRAMDLSHRTAAQMIPAAEPRARQLPTGIRGFVGREAELSRLDTALAEARTAVVISAISGMAGVGKTALALHWAHRVSAEFPDGQLYVNLRGFDPSGEAMTPGEALRGFLGALGVPAVRVPVELDSQANLYRSLLAGRRILVVLDNARDGEQVRPLLPGSPPAMVVVTSRNQLPGLVAAAGAQPLQLDILPPAEARRLLINRIGRERVEADPKAAAEIVARCARLPLALAIVAARAAARPTFPLSSIADELRETDPDIQAVFSWSYRALGEPAQRLFRLLGLHPGPEISTHAAASLAGGEARPLLGELARAHLIVERSPGRYVLHDLLRAYATELVRPEERLPALRRMLDHYLHTAHAADIALDPAGDRFSVEPPDPASIVDRFTGNADALAWFTTEHASLLAAIRLADSPDFRASARAVDPGGSDGSSSDRYVWQLARTMSTYFHRTTNRHDWVVTQTAALAAAGRAGDRAGQAYAHRDLGRAHARRGEFEQAHEHYGAALRGLAELGDRTASANVHLGLSWVLERQDDPAGARHHATEALDLYRSAGHTAGEARALNAVGWYDALMGEYALALEHCLAALAVTERMGDRPCQADTLDSVAYAHHQLGQLESSIEVYRKSLAIYRELGDPAGEAGSLTRLGDALLAAGDRDSAGSAWRDALRLLERLDHADAADVRTRLAGLACREGAPPPSRSPGTP